MKEGECEVGRGGGKGGKGEVGRKVRREEECQIGREGGEGRGGEGKVWREGECGEERIERMGQ